MQDPLHRDVNPAPGDRRLRGATTDQKNRALGAMFDPYQTQLISPEWSVDR